MFQLFAVLHPVCTWGLGSRRRLYKSVLGFRDLSVFCKAAGLLAFCKTQVACLGSGHQQHALTQTVYSLYKHVLIGFLHRNF